MSSKNLDVPDDHVTKGVSSKKLTSQNVLPKNRRRSVVVGMQAALEHTKEKTVL